MFSEEHIIFPSLEAYIGATDTQASHISQLWGEGCDRCLGVRMEAPSFLISIKAYQAVAIVNKIVIYMGNSYGE